MYGCKKWSGSCSLCPYAGYEPCPDEMVELKREILKKLEDEDDDFDEED